MTRDTLEQMFPYARNVQAYHMVRSQTTKILLEIDDKVLCQYRDPPTLATALQPHPARQFAVGRHPIRLVRGRRA